MVNSAVESIANNNQSDDHHTSGDSIPVGFEAAHLNLTRDSGVNSNGSGSSTGRYDNGIDIRVQGQLFNWP